MITMKNFATKLSAFEKATGKVANDAQALIVFGIQHANEHGDTGYLARFLTSCRKVRALPTNTLKAYIAEHVPNITIVGAEEGYTIKRKADSEGFVGKCIMPTVPWYDHVTNEKNQKDMDVLAAVAGLVKRIEKAQKEGHIKSDAETTAKALATLKALAA